MYVYIAGAMPWYAAILAHVMDNYSYPAPRLSLYIRRLPQTLDIKHMAVKWNSSMHAFNKGYVLIERSHAHRYRGMRDSFDCELQVFPEFATKRIAGKRILNHNHAPYIYLHAQSQSSSLFKASNHPANKRNCPSLSEPSSNSSIRA